MERRSAILNFTVRFPAKLLHTLLQQIAWRAYQQGWRDAKDGHAFETDNVTIDPAQLRKFQ